MLKGIFLLFEGRLNSKVLLFQRKVTFPLFFKRPFLGVFPFANYTVNRNSPYIDIQKFAA